MIIQNFSKLATNPLRKKALEILEAGLQSIQPETVFPQKIYLKDNILFIDKKQFNVDLFQNIYIVGIGKASLKTAQFLETILDSKITDGAVIDIQKGQLNFIRSFVGTHPLPSEKNITATSQIIKILKKAKKDDLVIMIISGGGSALLCQPFQITCETMQKLFQNLMHKGATIKEMNTFRKHISLIHGGNLAKLAYPATVVSLIFSDIPDTDQSLIASGPTFLDHTTVADAKKISDKFDLEKVSLVETPKDMKFFSKVTNILVISNLVALEAMAKKARSLGFTTKIFAHDFQSEAQKAGREILKALSVNKSAILLGGETTVKVNGQGLGGRNQELVLGAIPYLKNNQLIASIASDGKDNIKEAAGALADQVTIKKMKQQKLNAENFLAQNDSYHFFKKIEDAIVTSITGSNVSDLMLALSE